MAYTVIPTYTTNQLITSAHANTYWRDNINQLWPFTTAGDLAYASATTVLSRLGIGAAGKRLGSNGSVPSWLYGAPLLAYGIDTITSAWQSTTAQEFQDSPLSLTLSLPTAGIILAFAHFNVKSSSGSYDAIFRISIDGAGGVTHTEPGETYDSTSLSHIKACSAGNRVVKVEGYGYLSASMYMDDGELIAIAFPSA